MPEGHVTHRLARLHQRCMAGSGIAVSSPQGRFAEGAARLDGRVLQGVEAYGKHLFYRWDGAPVLHVHLGLVGVFRTHRFAGDHMPAPGSGVRLRLACAQAGLALDLSGPMRCELLDEAAVDGLVAALGPDPLRRDADPERALQALARRRLAIGAALLDQSVVAGIGNVFRAEGLFACGVSPGRPARDVAGEDFEALWRALRQMLRQAERSGRIVTVDPADVGAPSAARVPDGERVYVYRREGEPCRRCARPVAAWPLGGRLIYACSGCQPP